MSFATLLMRRIFLLLLFCAPFLVFAQPIPCTEDPPEMTSFCEDACIICDIDGFTGRHESNMSGMAPFDFCTVVVQEVQVVRQVEVVACHF